MRAKKGEDRWSPEITGCSNICIATDDESPRAANYSSSRVLYLDGRDIIPRSFVGMERERERVERIVRETRERDALSAAEAMSFCDSVH